MDTPIPLDPVRSFITTGNLPPICLTASSSVSSEVTNAYFGTGTPASSNIPQVINLFSHTSIGFNLFTTKYLAFSNFVRTSLLCVDFKTPDLAIIMVDAGSILTVCLPSLIMWPFLPISTSVKSISRTFTRIPFLLHSFSKDLENSFVPPPISITICALAELDSFINSEKSISRFNSI